MPGGRQAGAALLVAAALVVLPARADYAIAQWVIAAGGGASAGGSYGNIGTVGQGVAGASNGVVYAVGGGFWSGGTALTGGALDITLSVSVAGSGNGSVASNPGGVNCPGSCGFAFSNVAGVALDAAPADAGSVFTGWLGACTGMAACTLTESGTWNVAATFAPNDGFALRIDADENGTSDALADGLLVLRYLFGITGEALTTGVMGANPGLMTAEQVRQHLEDIRPLLDIDGNGQADAMTDGLLLIRYLFGVRGDPLVAGAIGGGARRATSGLVEAYIQSLLP